jgi:hypothetical protein
MLGMIMNAACHKTMVKFEKYLLYCYNSSAEINSLQYSCICSLTKKVVL